MPQLIAQPANSLAISSPNPLVLIPGSEPLLQSDYPNVKFWTRHSWTAVNKKANNSTTVKQKAAERGGTRMANGENVSMRFIEDADGAVIDGHRAQDIRRLMRTVFNHLADQTGGPAPTWTGYADVKQRYFYQEMASQFPELRLCELSWKSDKLAIDAYPSWYQTHVKKSIKAEIKTENSDEIVAVNARKKRSRPPSLLLSAQKKNKTKHLAPAHTNTTSVSISSVASPIASSEPASTTSTAPSESPEYNDIPIPAAPLADESESMRHDVESGSATVIPDDKVGGGKGKGRTEDAGADLAIPLLKVRLHDSPSPLTD